MSQQTNKGKWLVLEDDDCVHVVPETDVRPHGYPKKGNAKLSNIDCPCKPRIDFSNEKPRVVHNLFEDMVRIEQSMTGEKICLRCGFAQSFIRSEKASCSVWGKNYKKHLYK